MNSAGGTPLLELRGIVKHYGGVEALRGVDLAVGTGEVLAICGDNGAGKSTLIKVIAGAHAATSGTLLLQGRKVHWRSPHDALVSGVATIYQDLALAPGLSVWQNIFIGSELCRTVLPGLHLLDKKAMRAQAMAYMQRLQQRFDSVDRTVSGFSGGQRQAVAIARALRWNARLVIMDEPTAALGVAETAEVLDLIGRLRAQGITVLLVSHNMEDIVRVADRAIILKTGQVVASGPVAGLCAAMLTQAIITGSWPSMAAKSGDSIISHTNR